LKKYLLVEKNFNRQSVDGFIAQFRATIALTKLTQADIVQHSKEEERAESPNLGENLQMGQSITSAIPTKEPSSIVRDYIIPRKGQRLALLRLEFPATKQISTSLRVGSNYWLYSGR